MFDPDKRKYHRVNYPCPVTMCVPKGENETMLGDTSNISEGGVCVHMNQEVFLGVTVDMQINFVNLTSVFKCQGTVVRCELEPLSERKSIEEIKPMFYDIGIEFLEISQNDHERLREALQPFI